MNEHAPAERLLKADGGPVAVTSPLERKQRVGTVKFFSLKKGYGFISPEGRGRDVFVHISAVKAAGWETLEEGQRVAYDTTEDKRGASAINLHAA